MKRATVVSSVLLAAVLVPVAVAQGWRRRITPGPYRVVLTDPANPRGSRIPDVYLDDERLTEAFNRLQSEGATPVWIATLYDDRIVIVARER